MTGKVHLGFNRIIGSHRRIIRVDGSVVVAVCIEVGFDDGPADWVFALVVVRRGVVAGLQFLRSAPRPIEEKSVAVLVATNPDTIQPIAGSIGMRLSEWIVVSNAGSRSHPSMTDPSEFPHLNRDPEHETVTCRTTRMGIKTERQANAMG